MVLPVTKASNSVDTLAAPDPATLIQTERAQLQFDPVLMNYFLEGNQERSEKTKMFVQQMERDPILAVDSSYYDLTKDQSRELAAVKIARLSQYIEQESTEDFLKRLALIGVFDPALSTRVGINLGLFLSCVRGNGTAEQVKYWSLTKETEFIKGIYGCFGMTELAHGSNVAGLETTATFDKETDEFVINTPHIGATKWWIGGAAHSASHCSVYARLIVDGKDYGVKTFVVPLRDSNHNLQPGVTCGDIGAKMGRDAIDNGWIQFSSVRVPRFFMLQKFCKVTREGEVTLPPLEQLSYSALLGGRVTMVMDSYRMSARFATVALRYAIGRRQFKPAKGGDKESQLLDYPLHQRRLLPFLAWSYVLSAGAYKLEQTIYSTIDTLEKAVAANDMKQIGASIVGMKSLFVDSGSLKSTATWLTADVIDQSRQACGGHGYSSYSGFGKAYNDWVVQCTWEGDNNVLAMSAGKPIVKEVSQVVELGKKIRGSTAFLNNAKQYLNEDHFLTSAADFKDSKKLLTAIEVVITRAAYQASQTLKANNGDTDTIGPELVVLSKLKAHHYLFNEFLERVKSIPAEQKALVPFLELQGQLYAATVVFDKFAGEFLTYSVLSTKLVGELTSKIIPALCREVRPHTVAYTDGFQQSDMIINSGIGKYNGDIYENYFNIVKAQNPPKFTKAPYSAELETMLNRPSKDVRERFEKSAEAARVLSK